MTQSSLPAPPKHDNRPFVIAAMLMLLGMGGLLYWKFSRKPAESAAPPPLAVASEPVATILEAPPPPPPPAEESDSVPSEPARDKSTPPASAAGSGGPCGPVCDGDAPAALTGALHGIAKQSQTCYERALRQNATLQGRLVVAMRLTAVGTVCSARVSSNTLGDPSVASCVLQKFKAAQLPKPSGGCVDLEFPIQFKPQGQ